MDLPLLPRAVQLVIDDVGRRMGMKARGPMYRRPPVIDRIMEPADYATIADIGEATGMRPQMALEFCDFDRDNVCAKVPSTTWMGADWDNSGVYGPWVDEVWRIFEERGDHLELGVHGVAHDYWIDGEPVGPEWYDQKAGEVRPDVQGHMDCIREIFLAHELDRRLGVDFPESFVACYFQYFLADGDPDSTGALAVRNGIRYASNPFPDTWHAYPPEFAPDAAYDSGLLLLERDHTGVRWDQMATVPPRPPTTSIIGMHWSNHLHQDLNRNAEIAQAWIDYLRGLEDEDDIVLARNTAQCWSQWCFHTYATVGEAGGGIRIDLTSIPDRIWDMDYPQTMVLKFPRAGKVTVESADFEVVSSRRSGRGSAVELRPCDRVGGTVRIIG